MGVWVLQNKELPDTETCQALLGRILLSSQLKRSTRMRDLLAYVGRRALEEGCEHLHEQEIGIEVFGRPAGYDTSADNIVRVNATELRKRIDAYFETDGIDEPLIMEIPRGSYIPVFRHRPVESTAVAEPVMPAIPPTLPPEAGAEIVAKPLTPAAPPARRRWPWIAGTVAACAAAAVLAIFCVRLSLDNHAMHEQLHPWENEPAVSAFWTGFLGANRTTDVVLSDTAFGLYQNIRKQSYSLQDYLNRSYANQLPKENLDPRVRDTLQILGRRTLVSRGEFAMAEDLNELDPLNSRVRMYFARGYNPVFLKRHNVVLFGTRPSNPWMEIFENRLAFPAQRNPNFADSAAGDIPRQIIANRTPASGEQASYTPSGAVGYCSAAYFPNPERTGRVLLIEGTSSDAAEGCGDFLLSEPGMENLQNKLGGSGFSNFQVLLRTSQVIDTPITATIVAVRTGPNPH